MDCESPEENCLSAHADLQRQLTYRIVFLAMCHRCFQQRWVLALRDAFRLKLRRPALSDMPTSALVSLLVLVLPFGRRWTLSRRLWQDHRIIWSRLGGTRRS